MNTADAQPASLSGLHAIHIETIEGFLISQRFPASREEYEEAFAANYNKRAARGLVADAEKPQEVS